MGFEVVGILRQRETAFESLKKEGNGEDWQQQHDRGWEYRGS